MAATESVAPGGVHILSGVTRSRSFTLISRMAQEARRPNRFHVPVASHSRCVSIHDPDHFAGRPPRAGRVFHDRRYQHGKDRRPVRAQAQGRPLRGGLVIARDRTAGAHHRPPPRADRERDKLSRPRPYWQAGTHSWPRSVRTAAGQSRGTRLAPDSGSEPAAQAFRLRQEPGFEDACLTSTRRTERPPTPPEQPPPHIRGSASPTPGRFTLTAAPPSRWHTRRARHIKNNSTGGCWHLVRRSARIPPHCAHAPSVPQDSARRLPFRDETTDPTG